MTAVYQAINAVSQELANVGVAKSRKNQQQGWAFRGIDEVMNALAPLLATHKLIVFPRMLHREQTERVSKSGSATFYTTVHAEFDFVSAVDGSKHTASTFGEGMDSADKSTNKAMSAAYKYAAFLTFCIPTEGGNDLDPDAVTPEPLEPAPTTQRRPAEPAPARPAPGPTATRAMSQVAAAAPQKTESDAVLELLVMALNDCETLEHLQIWQAKNGRHSGAYMALSAAHKQEVERKFKALQSAIRQKQKAA